MTAEEEKSLKEMISRVKADLLAPPAIRGCVMIGADSEDEYIVVSIEKKRRSKKPSPLNSPGAYL